MHDEPTGRRPGCRYRMGGALADATAVRRRGPEHPQMAAAADLDSLPDGLCRRGRGSRLPDRVRERLQVVLHLRAAVDRQPDDLPSPGRGQPVGVPAAEVVTVRLHVRGERAEHRRGVTVDIGEGVDRGPVAGGTAAPTWTQRPASFEPPPAPGPPTAARQRHPGASARRPLTTADGIRLRTVTPSPRAVSAFVSLRRQGFRISPGGLAGPGPPGYALDSCGVSSGATRAPGRSGAATATTGDCAARSRRRAPRCAGPDRSASTTWSCRPFPS